MAESSALELLGRLLPSLALIVGALLILRRWSRRGADSQTSIRVLGRTGVSRNGVVAVVEVGTQRYLVGAGDAGVTLLAQLGPEPVGERTESGGTGLGDAAQPAPPRPPALRRGNAAPVRSWSGLVHRLQAMTVRTSVEALARENR